jgi:4-amino-4-deoxychorismate lyase
MFLETIRLEDGKIFHLEYHQRRVAEVFEKFGCHQSPLDLYNYLKELPQQGVYRVRVVYSLDEVLSLEYIPYHKREIKTLRLVEDRALEYRYKFANREAIDTLFTLREGCDEILITQNGYIKDTSIANVAFYDGKVWWTPKSPLLRGTTRQRFLENGFLHLKDIHKDEIFSYKGFALMNAMVDFDIITQVNLKDIMC